MNGKHMSNLLADIEKMNAEMNSTSEMWNMLLLTKIALATADLADTFADIRDRCIENGKIMNELVKIVGSKFE